MISLETARKLIPCGCGCGELIEPFDKKGRPHKFLPGHSSRVYHPMRGKSALNCKGGRINKQGYKEIYIPLDERLFHNCKSDGYELEHRYVMENILGRKLEKYEAVHHINDNKLDNRPENLKLMTHSSHAKYESKNRPINWKCIEAMRRKNIKPVKDICKVEGCNNIVYARGICNKHYHYYRKGKLEFTADGIIIHPTVRKSPPIRERVCKQCGKLFLSRGNNCKYCEICRTPSQHTKRSRLKKKGVNI